MHTKQKYLCLCISDKHMYVCMLVLASAWVAWCLGRSPVFLRPSGRRGHFSKLRDKAWPSISMRLKRIAAATGRPAWARYTTLDKIYSRLQSFGGILGSSGSILSSAQSQCTCYKGNKCELVSLGCTNFTFFLECK